MDFWVHNSSVAVWSRSDMKVLDTPEIGNIIAKIKMKQEPIFIKDICAHWEKIEFNDIAGWV